MIPLRRTRPAVRIRTEKPHAAARCRPDPGACRTRPVPGLCALPRGAGAGPLQPAATGDRRAGVRAGRMGRAQPRHDFVHARHQPAKPADDRVLHHHRNQRQPVVAEDQWPPGAGVPAAGQRLRRRAEPAGNRCGYRFRPASAVRRAGGFDHADRRPGDRPRLRAAVRTGRRHWRGIDRSGFGDGRHRLRRADRWPGRHRVDPALRAGLLATGRPSPA